MKLFLFDLPIVAAPKSIAFIFSFSQGRYWNRSYVGNEAGAHHEVHNSGRYGREVVSIVLREFTPRLVAKTLLSPSPLKFCSALCCLCPNIPVTF